MSKSITNRLGDEPRFQWSLQRSVKIKSIPWLLSELLHCPRPLNLNEMEDRFNLKYGIVKAVRVVDKQRPFMRTMDFLKNDLSLLNNDYSPRTEEVKDEDQDALLETIIMQPQAVSSPSRPC